ncbi:sn-glycerol 3-phosphate transport system permease protein [Nocardioides luteus]|uniref:Glycerol-3-phosphate ABC transporter permease n=1 Tax=Nocardioides luteus TaxID=1844 RepID=A0ABQ5SYI4_9ACTN|nr:carbohydrate ABC transporter permease [Nocardioides luteus]MDR7312273.1 sn-glycerol 3-phosphate transport system permease protein [Nocardioides luteus]GGR57147.1 glycerol-3-phosphate ABC transporter permease [Nocardioides luteus]GLJ68519.1 glycerol-3-phosphate ABC transporter permease [Nocardioides luteus]
MTTIEAAAAPKAQRRGLRALLLRDYLVLVISVLIVLLPLVYLLFSSFKSPGDLATTQFQLMPETWSTANYDQALDQLPFGRFFLNSAIVTVVGAGLKVLLAIFTAYGLVFCEFPGKTYIFWAVLATLMVPPQVTVLPNFVFISGLGGVDTYWGLILPGLATGFGTFLLRQAFMQLPPEIMEAAELDGAGHWHRLWHHVVPMAGPSIATVALVNVVYEWNDYLWPLVITNDPDMMTLARGITLLRNSDNLAASVGPIMAGTVMVLVPVLLLFAVLQRHIVNGFTQGGVKG